MLQGERRWSGSVWTPREARGWLIASALLLTVAAIVLAEALKGSVVAGVQPPPAALLVLPFLGVAYASLAVGLWGGLAAAALVVAYGVHLFDASALLALDADAWVRQGSLALAAFAMAGLVGGLKARADLAVRHEIGSMEEALGRERDLSASLLRSNRALQQANRTLESFSYMVSHDLKEPVRALKVYNEALAEDFVDTMPPEARELARRNLDATHRLEALVNGLLDLSRAGRVVQRDLSAVRVVDAVNAPECTARFEDVARQRRADVETVAQDDAPPARATASAIAQVVGNLVVNGIRHNPSETPRVRVSIGPSDEEGSMVQIVVEDDGPGMSREALDRFSTEDPAALLGRGALRNGFGTAIVRRTVDSLGGRVWAGRSQELGGAAVHVTLPAARRRPRA